MTAPRVIVAGGHSAGHIEPAMNFADALRRLEPMAEITALGTARGLDTTLIPARGYPLELIPPAPLPRRLSRTLLQTPGRRRDSVLAAGAVLDRVRAEVLLVTGGSQGARAINAAGRHNSADRHRSAHGGAAGSCTVTQRPPLARGVTVRIPSWAWVMLLTMARPRPTPA